MKRTSFSLGTLLIVCLLALSSSHAPMAAASNDETNWPQWRGPLGSGISTDKNLPTEWSETKNVQWKTAIPGRGHSSPIIWGNRIFLTTSIEGPVVAGAKAVTHIRRGQVYRHPDSVGGDHSYTIKVLCLDRETGKILWERTAYEGTVYDDRHRKNTFASATPVTDGKYVWALFDAEGLYCYDFDGKLIWKTSLGKFGKMGMGNGMSPVLFENLVILQCDQEDGGPGSFIAALDKLTGKEVWRVARTQRKTWATPVLVRTPQRTELIASGAESIVSYDPATGKELWHSEGVVSHAIPSAVTGHGMVFVWSSHVLSTPNLRTHDSLRTRRASVSYSLPPISLVERRLSLISGMSRFFASNILCLAVLRTSTRESDCVAGSKKDFGRMKFEHSLYEWGRYM